jgi:hypothetical protein
MMDNRQYKPFLWLGILILTVGLACNAASRTATEAPAPTNTPQPVEPTPTLRPPKPTPTPPEPTATSPPEEPTATTPPEDPTPDTDTQTGSALELDTEMYAHPKGIFSFFPPKDWEITDEQDGSVFLEAPDFTGAILVQVTNTGYTLDEFAFERFVDARDENFFFVYEDYFQVSWDIDLESRTANIEKSLSFDGIPQTVISYYDQHEQVIYVLDFWADEGIYADYADGYDAFFDAIVVDDDIAAEQELYYWVYDFYGPDDLFVIEVPDSWTWELDEGEFAVVDTLSSPDEHAFIQNITFDDGVEVSKSDAGDFALELLNDYYADDIKITDDDVQPDGSERLTWNSPSGDYSGISFFETRGTTFLLFTALYDNPYEDIYLDTLDYAISTYDVPE